MMNLAMTDREAVRPPMQWADRPGGGFTDADEAELPRPIVSDGPFGYHQAERRGRSERDPGSLLNWMERTIRTRKEWPVIGWGDWQMVGTRNTRVLAHIGDAGRARQCWRSTASRTLPRGSPFGCRRTSPAVGGATSSVATAATLRSSSAAR